MATKPIGYYCTSEPQISELEQQFGSYLEKLDRWDKIQIQLTMALLVTCMEVDPGATIQDAISETPLEAYSDKAFEAIQILDGLSQDGAESLIMALSYNL